ncbi:WapI family immunity protein [Cryptosporangium minutisporangium]|uniref:Uncharacterized protein n=1 Tax=Cryptosporangium minutisporangium TaxID=113569 RepID=A0ABP6TBQ0_9ACTN
MRLISDDGAVVELRVTGYQIPDLAGPHDPAGDARWDANWLTVLGRVTTSNGRGWEFSDPCLMVEEAHALSGWLRTAAVGRFPGYRRREGSALTFLEPNLEFALRSRTADRAVLRVRFSYESAPEPTLRGRPVAVLVRMRPDALLRAGGEWSEEIARFPQR